MLSFRRADRERVARGEITVTYRLWKTAKVKAGKRYGTEGGAVDVESVDVIPAALVAQDDVALSGCESIAAIWELAGDHTKTRVTPDTLLFRVQFHFVSDDDETAPPTISPDAPNTDDIANMRARLDRMDRMSSRGPWARDVLRIIERSPHVSARILSAELDWERLDFKAHVRRLKRMGLTRSFEVGYEVTELGRGVLRAALPTPARPAAALQTRRRRRASADGSERAFR